MEALLKLDAQALLWVETNLAGSFADWPMRILSDLRFFAPFILVLLWWLITKGGPKGRVIVLGSLLTVLLCDQLSATVIKPLVGRHRPHSSSFSFPSSHATNIFGQALLFSRYYPKISIALFTLASAVGFSRVYLGKHYPLDVLGGAVLGTTIGFGVYWLIGRYEEPISARIEKLNWNKSKNLGKPHV
ncbi:phosphatase PAP2 family protein [Myxococcota bacterium]|nr:phosphatase PAP2 family protein [Myxococcota bacterium]